MFPIELWNHYTNAINQAPKTTNCTEGFHNALKSIFLASHPSVWAVIRGLKKDIAIQRLVVIEAQMENNDRPKIKYQVIAQRLCQKKLQDTTKNMTN